MPAKPRKKYGLKKSGETEELSLPSGELCLVRRPGVQGLIKAGILDSLDSLTGIVQIDHIDANDPKKMAKAVESLARRPDDLASAMELLDKVLVYVVVEPKVYLRSDPPAQQDDETLYADEVDETDKQFIFQFVVGGTRDIERFREEQQKLLGSLSVGEDVQLPSE